MTERSASPGELTATAIRDSGLTIYDLVDRHGPLFYDIDVLEHHLRTKLHGLTWSFPLRTRAKHSKIAVATAMGYPVPRSFQRTQPRFPGQDLDVYVQKANSLQIWNEKVAPSRRYALIRLNQADSVADVRVVTGEVVALLDKTGTLTSKFQATRRIESSGSVLVSMSDTANFQLLLEPVSDLSETVLSSLGATQPPRPRYVLSIAGLYQRLLAMVGQEIEDQGLDQERVRGEALHRLACRTLGLGEYGDLGHFPDILCQALEVKLQSAPTIDLGLVLPSSVEPAEEVAPGVRHCDVRYCVAYAVRVAPTHLRISEIVLTTGEGFFTQLRRFEGRVQNRKLQIPLPAGFFREPE